jgi:glycosyltransferase involved in cell wall biosynthesis
MRSLVFRSFDALCAVGSRAHRRLVDAGVREEHISLSPYTIDVDRFASTRRLTRHDARARVGVPEGMPVVLFAGKLTERKRPIDVVRAMRMLDEPARLVVAGDGPLRDRLFSEARHAHIATTDLGFVNQSSIPYVYRAADVLALPSAWEPWGLAINEAMACGTPAVCSAEVSAGDDLVRPVSEHLVHASGDKAALAASLSYALSAPPGQLECCVIKRIDRWTNRESVTGLRQAFEIAVAARG